MNCKKINLSTWATRLKSKTSDVGELRFSHVNWVSSVEADVKITVKTGDIERFKKELENLLQKYHIHNIWEERKAKPRPEPEPTKLEKALAKHGLKGGK